MEWIACVWVMFVIFFLFGAFYVVKMPDSPSGRTPNRELLGLLPAIYYFLAVFCGMVLLGFTALNSDELNSTQIGAWIGYTVGAVLSMFAVGRVIQLLQQIRDAVRS